jgi:hypothetical protein
MWESKTVVQMKLWQVYQHFVFNDPHVVAPPPNFPKATWQNVLLQTQHLN